MSKSLNVIALISGGKDSLYSILHCLENGHNVVALANLYPAKTAAGTDHKDPLVAGADDGNDFEGEDLNSFMYQTVGHSVIPLYAECLGLPLYRREITGSAVQTGRYYDASVLGSSLDETEDLIFLLKEVMRAHPEAQSLCSGAILSTYQRTRVESIAVRLGLTPLAYLWQYPALPPPNERGESLTGLLDDMAAARCDARIIKIASGGIKEGLLWSNVTDPRTQSRLINGLQPFFPNREFWLRGAVLGEGGEYETLCINGPKRLWKKRIELSEEQVSTFTGEGGVSYLRLANPRTVQNQPDNPEDNAESLRVPQTFDQQFQAVLTMVRSQKRLTSRPSADKFDGAGTRRLHPLLNNVLQGAESLTSGHLFVSNLTSHSLSPIGSPDAAGSQMRQICNNLKSSLNSLSSSLKLSRPLMPSDIISTILLLKDISNFGVVNSVYASLFRPGEPNPPARVTFACSLPEDVEVSLSVILDLGPREARRGLHVQSWSYWAPANIGPYSQAICVPVDREQNQRVNAHDAELPEMVHMAGQIPLIPQSMRLSQADFQHQAVLSLQHLWRVGQERGSDIWPWGIAFLENCKDAYLRAELSCQLWQQTHLAGTRAIKVLTEEGEEDEEGPDAWDLHYNRAATYEASATQMKLGQHLHLLPNPAVFWDAGSASTLVPPFIAAEVVSLPRNAPIEWWSMGVTNLPKMHLSKPRVSVTQKDHAWGSVTKLTILPPSKKGTGTFIQLVTVLFHQAATSASSGVNLALVEDDLLAITLPDKSLPKSTSPPVEVVHGTALVSAQGQEQWSQIREHRLFKDMVVVPCNSVWGYSNPGANANVEQDGRSALSKPSLVNSRTASLGIEDTRDGTRVVLSRPLSIAITMRIDERRGESR